MSIALAAKNSDHLPKVAVVVQTDTAVHCPGDKMVAPVEICDSTHTCRQLDIATRPSDSRIPQQNRALTHRAQPSSLAQIRTPVSAAQK